MKNIYDMKKIEQNKEDRVSDAAKKINTSMTCIS